MLTATFGYSAPIPIIPQPTPNGVDPPIATNRMAVMAPTAGGPWYLSTPVLITAGLAVIGGIAYAFMRAR